MNCRMMRGAALLALGMVAAGAAAQSAWTVKPEWVRAHESFLASDAMRGRGSATHDEEVAATYVASEFEGYGLQHAPGMDGYIQSAEVVAPVLDGKATITAGNVTLNEGKDFDLLVSGGEGAAGPMVRISAADAGAAKVPRGAVVLLTDLPSDLDKVMEITNPIRRWGASAVLLSGASELSQLYSMFGGKTRMPIHLAGQKARRGGTTIAVLRQPLVAADGTAVKLEVRALPQEARHTYNAVGYLPGTDPKAGTILLTAHLDHLGIGKPVNGDALYNGANDDAAGTTAVLELAHALAAGPKLRRSVLFVCYGSEELGGLGSTYFGEHPPVALKELVANLEFEMIGAQDPKMPKGVLLLTGWERSNLGPTLKAHGALLGPDPYPEQHFFERSDNYSLALMGVVAHTAAGWGTVPTYHRPDDDLAHLDMPFMTAAIQSLIEPVRWLAESDFVPKWEPGGQPKP